MRLINYRSNFVVKQHLNSNQLAKPRKLILLNMSHKTALSKNELPLAIKLVEQSPENGLDIAKFATSVYVKLGIFLSLAVVVHLPGFNRAVRANDSTYSASFSTESNSSSRRSHPEISTLLPRVFNLIAASVRTQSAALLDPAQNFSASGSLPPSIKSTSFNSVSDARQSNFTKVIASAKPNVKSPQRIHQVQQGDTISKIARKYHVSNDDIVDINQISNSNVIFVNQRLKIPANQVSSNNTLKLEAKITPTKSSKQYGKDRFNSTLNSKQQASAISSSKINRNHSDIAKQDNDPYIANLRREIELLRAKNQQKSKTNAVPVSVNTKRNHQTRNQSKISRDRLSQSQVKLNAPLPKLSFSSNLIEEETVALNLPLPPLPDSQEYLPSAFDGYIWPAQGVLTSGYGWRWGRMHKGIDIAAPIGTPIFAAASGKVVGAGWHSGYGNLIKLEHLDGSYTLYAHNHRNLVRHGQRVRQGEQIAEMGSTGRSTGSHLHFEIHREDRKVINPLALLGRKY